MNYQRTNVLSIVRVFTKVIAKLEQYLAACEMENETITRRELEVERDKRELMVEKEKTQAILKNLRELFAE